MSEIVKEIKKILRESINSTPEKAAIFFKTSPGDYAEHDQFIGVTVPVLRKIAKDFISLPLEDLGILIKSRVNEERLFVLIILVKQYEKASNSQKENIYKFYLDNIKYVNNWNLVDNSAHMIMGAHLLGKDCSILEEFARSENLWKRRIAIVTTWYFIRKFELEWSFKIAKMLQKDSHDLIHKAVGWMLREAGKKDKKILMKFLSENVSEMPKAMFRYAVEKLSDEEKSAIIRRLVKNFGKKKI